MPKPDSPDLSPYRPPALLATQQPLLSATRPPLPLPLWGAAGFAALAAAAHFGAEFIERLLSERLVFPVQLLLPLAMLPLFAIFCLQWYSSPFPVGSAPRHGKLLVFLLIVPGSLLIFVPAFVATFLATYLAAGMLLGFMLAPWPLSMLIALLGAYFLTAVGVARWLWWWSASHRGGGLSA